MERENHLSRRDFLKSCITIGGALVAGAYGVQSGNRKIHRNYKPERKKDYLESIHPPTDMDNLPNIIVIITDDLGYGDLGVYGNPTIRTSNIDKLAADGCLLTHFYSTAPMCSPSRAGLLTGRYPVRTMVTSALYPSGSLMNPVLDVFGYHSFGIRGIPEDEILVSEVLKQRGYSTGIIGKWHLGDKSPYLPNERGFDEFFGAYYSNDMDHYQIFRNDQVELDHPVDQDRITGLMTREAIKFIKSNSDNPFFLYLAHPMPHEPIHAAKDFREKSAAGLYGDSVEEIDWSVGEIMETIENLDLEEKTFIAFTSDNGPWWQGNPGLTRGRKILVFEGGFRVPLITKWPGYISPGYTCDALCMNFDLFSTILDIAGISPPKDRIIDGKSMLPLLQRKAESIHDTLYFFKTKKLMGIRHGKWKYLRRQVTENSGYWPLSHGPFLFNLDTDPNESYSMIETEPELARLLSQMMDEFETTINKNLRGWL